MCEISNWKGDDRRPQKFVGARYDDYTVRQEVSGWERRVAQVHRVSKRGRPDSWSWDVWVLSPVWEWAAMGHGRTEEEAQRRADAMLRALGVLPMDPPAGDASSRIPPPQGSVGVEIELEPRVRGGAWVRLAPNGYLAPHLHEGAVERCIVVEGGVQFRISWVEGGPNERWEEMRGGTGVAGQLETFGFRAGFMHALRAGARGALLLCTLDPPPSASDEAGVRGVDLGGRDAAWTVLGPEQHARLSVETFGGRPRSDVGVHGPGAAAQGLCEAEIAVDPIAVELAHVQAYLRAEAEGQDGMALVVLLEAADAISRHEHRRLGHVQVLRDTRPDIGEASESTEAAEAQGKATDISRDTRAQFAAAVDEAHEHLHAAENGAYAAGLIVWAVEALRKAHEALHRVGAGTQRVACANGETDPEAKAPSGRSGMLPANTFLTVGGQPPKGWPPADGGAS